MATDGNPVGQRILLWSSILSIRNLKRHSLISKIQKVTEENLIISVYRELVFLDSLGSKGCSTNMAYIAFLITERMTMPPGRITTTDESRWSNCFIKSIVPRYQ